MPICNQLPERKKKKKRMYTYIFWFVIILKAEHKQYNELPVSRPQSERRIKITKTLFDLDLLKSEHNVTVGGQLTEN